MKKAIILGAGASKAYNESLTGVKMPIACDFFSTFNKLDISENPWVMIGFIINYLRDNHGMKPEEFTNFNSDIEELHSEIEQKVLDGMANTDYFFHGKDNFQNFKAYMELVFLFASVINEIQNGPVSLPHRKLASLLNSNDSIITFNWDTLMDRALMEETNWNTYSGYYITPKAVYQNGWQYVDTDNDEIEDIPLLLKLHGSSNWITSHLRPEKDKFVLTQQASANTFYVYESTEEPYDTYRGRYMGGYSDLSYGYYPPNIPDEGEKLPEGFSAVKLRLSHPLRSEGTSRSSGLESMAMIIPPVKYKSYDLFGDCFAELWKKAESEIYEADHIIIIGYSFPKTDYQTNELFRKAFMRRTTMPKITIVNPNPDSIVDKFRFEFGIVESNIFTRKAYFSSEFPMEDIFKDSSYI